jgi:predicted nucleotidyltransferase
LPKTIINFIEIKEQMETTQHIIDTIRDKESFLKSRYFIKHMELYGSFAREQQKVDSDIDLLYTTIPDGEMTLARLRSFENYLTQLLNIEKIELVSKQSLNPIVEKKIKKDAISIF